MDTNHAQWLADSPTPIQTSINTQHHRMKYRWWKTQPLEPAPIKLDVDGSAADLLHQTTDP